MDVTGGATFEVSFGRERGDNILDRLFAESYLVHIHSFKGDKDYLLAHINCRYWLADESVTIVLNIRGCI